MHSDTTNRAPRPNHLKRQIPRVRMSHHLHHHIRASSLRCIFDLLHRVIIEMDWNRSESFRLLQSFRDGIDRVHFIHHRQRASNRTDADWSAADTDDGVFLPITFWQIFQESRRGEVARGEDVRHENQHLFRDSFWCQHERRVCERTSHEFGLAAVDGVGGRRVAEEFAFGAARGLAADAVVAGSAGGVKGDDDLFHHHHQLNPHSYPYPYP